MKKEMHQLIEEQKVVSVEVAQSTAAATLKTFEDLAKSTAITSAKLECELERIHACFEVSTETKRAVAALRSEVKGGGLRSIENEAPPNCKEALQLSAISMEDGGNGSSDNASEGIYKLEVSIRDVQKQLQLQAETLEDLWATRQHNRTRISELVNGLENVVNSVVSKDQTIRGRLDSLEASVSRLSESSIIDDPTKGSESCSLTSFPLMTVKEDNEEQAQEMSSPDAKPCAETRGAFRIEGDTGSADAVRNLAERETQEVVTAVSQIDERVARLEKGAVGETETQDKLKSNMEGMMSVVAQTREYVAQLEAQLKQLLLDEKGAREKFTMDVDASMNLSCKRSDDLEVITGWLQSELSGVRTLANKAERAAEDAQRGLKQAMLLAGQVQNDRPMPLAIDSDGRSGTNSVAFQRQPNSVQGIPVALSASSAAKKKVNADAA
jgi:hypothetical protein